MLTTSPGNGVFSKTAAAAEAARMHCKQCVQCTLKRNVFLCALCAQ